MTSVTPMAMKKREDVVTDGGIADDIVKNAPATEDHFSSSRRWWNEPCAGPARSRREAMIRFNFEFYSTALASALDTDIKVII